jgi:hypothetical protein
MEAELLPPRELPQAPAEVSGEIAVAAEESE